MKLMYELIIEKPVQSIISYVQVLYYVIKPIYRIIISTDIVFQVRP